MKVKKGDHTTQWLVSSQMEISYSVVEHPDLFSSDDPNLFGNNAAGFSGNSRRLLCVDTNVNQLYGDKIRAYFSNHTIEPTFVELDLSEESKNRESLFKVLEAFNDFKVLRKQEPIIAIGGGILLDVVGMAANLYRRGIPYIRVPTTLIGLIDAGIGVKTSANFLGHKNRIGTYYAPIISYVDPTFLRTLDTKHVSSGLAEILKIAVIKDPYLFKLLEESGTSLLKNKLQNCDISREVLHRAIKGMLDELEPNLWESNLERIVDFGHTFSGFLEMKSEPRLLHGEAVSIDMALASVLAFQRKLLSHSELSRVLLAIRNLQLPRYHELCQPVFMYEALQDTTIHRDGLQRMPIPKGIGRVEFVNDISIEEISEAIQVLKTN